MKSPLISHSISLLKPAYVVINYDHNLFYYVFYSYLTKQSIRKDYILSDYLIICSNNYPETVKITIQSKK